MLDSKNKKANTLKQVAGLSHLLSLRLDTWSVRLDSNAAVDCGTAMDLPATPFKLFVRV